MMGRTSTAVKRRYNEKVYTQIALAVPKELAERFTEKCTELGISKRAVLIEAIEAFLAEK
jgi:predicted DNA-binding protein